MNECIRLSERMPHVAHGRAEWTPAELHHFSGCAGCRSEWELVRAASRIGEGVLPEMDPAEMSRTILGRLEHSKAPGARRRIWSMAGLAAAAALAGVLWSGKPEPAPHLPAEAAVAGLEISLPELDGLQPAELDSVLRHIDDPLAADPAPENGELSDLDSEELETMLDFWEG
jgi:hypothetical protein